MIKHIFLIAFLLVVSGCDGKTGQEQSRGERRALSGVDYLSGPLVTTLNVGTGNCQILTCPSDRKMIVNDCGTKGGGIMDVPEVVNTIALATKVNDVVITISHADEDHYSYIPDIINGNGDVSLVVLGGGKSAYSSGKAKEFVGWLKDQGVNFDYVDVNYTSNSSPYLGCPKDKVDSWVMANDYGSTKNSKSLVIYSRFSGWNKYRGFFFTGDSTGDTHLKIYDNLINNRYSNLGQIDTYENVMTMPHHGAESHKSNTRDWASFTNSAVVLASAGLNNQYRHPRCSALEAYDATLRDSEQHNIKCGDDEYYWLTPKVSKAIYGTNTSGNVVVSFSGGGVDVATFD